MWQIQWLIALLPDSVLLTVINLIVLVGLAGTLIGFFFMRFFRFLQPYKTIVQIIGVVLLVVGVYLKGSYSTEMAWRDRVHQLEAQVKASEEKAVEKNVEIQEKIVYKTKKIKEIQVVNRERIVEKRVEIDKDCIVAPEAISIHNAAAKNVIQEPVE
jgi:hypothetical protein